ALLPVIPPETEFPYAIRVVSEILSSNGSTSMASTCGSTMSLMDAGAPLLAPVAGISIGIVDDVLLTDIIGLEDYHGDMDFKVAGTESGITAIQLDVKVPGLTLEICKQTLDRAHSARLEILKAMLKVLPKHRPELSPFAHRISTVSIPVDKIGELIGPGGKNIKKLMADNSVTIDVNDDGSVFVSGTDDAGVAHVLSYLQAMGKEVVVGEVYDGVVANILPFGAFINILPGRDGLVHVSQMASGFVSDPNTLVKMGQTVKVWVTDVDLTTGKIGLSMLFDASGQPVVKPREERAPRAPFRRDSFSSGPMRRGFDRDRGPRRRF
ncbi:S1 RNA-binding domain-containing protein, partial [Candidatus Amesbacteria bacterium]|nr:S1 RNA-binding domain-containing protein [Candidatus Amesbacteria bacterium]